MKVRLIAYRKATTSATVESTYELELLTEPNISLNYQFDDVKNPDKKKGSFSQTFKLPFTNKNNQFFQDWYNVNLDTLVFDTKKEFDASIYVGTVSQFDGTLQLRNVYQKAQYYEVVLFSKISTLFSLIGDESLRDAFLSIDGDSWNTSLNHRFNVTQMKNSWDGSSSDFENADEVSLKDPDHDIQKVMYPFSATKPQFYYQSNVNQYLNLQQDDIDVDDEPDTLVDITQFRPAIQIKEMIKIILGKNGLSYTSAFIDSEYFSKIFMTTGGHLEDALPPVISGTTTVVAPGQCIVGYAEDSSWGIFGTEDNLVSGGAWTNNCDDQNVLQYYLEPDTVGVDDSGCYNASLNFFRKLHPTQTSLNIKSRSYRKKARLCNPAFMENNYGFRIRYELVKVKANGELAINPLTGNEVIYAEHEGTIDSNNDNGYNELSPNIDITDLNVGNRFRIRVTVYNWYFQSGANCALSLGLPCNCNADVFDDPPMWCTGYSSIYNSNPTGTIECLSTYIKMNYDGYDLENYDSVINVPACIDPDLKQKDFFKDLIQRFNLIVTQNPNNPSNIIIEPYDTYLGSGTIRYWTDKLDLSKEQIVTDTSSLQKERIFFTDKEDEDLMNKEIKEQHAWANVYGRLEITETNNKWAKGELKNSPMFSPYINGQILKTPNSQNGYQTMDLWGNKLDNVAIQYEFSYEINDDNVEITSAHTQPKLFWYNGTPTDIKDEGEARTIYMHAFTALVGWTAFSFTNYPLCSPYELTPNATTDTAFITPTTKSLYWDSWATPVVPDLEVFNWVETTPSNWGYCLYGYYWHQYLTSLHHPESRLMDCYLNLNEVDIFNFDFNDEIFIKDSYWRILKIHNYQVGVKASTKVTLLKIVDTLIGSECGWSASGTELYNDLYIYWCPNTDTDCTTPVIFAPVDCCHSRGGTPDISYTAAAEANGYTNGELPCKAYQGSKPISRRILSSNTNIRDIGGYKGIASQALVSKFNNFSVGSGKTKTSVPIMPLINDDISIKYQTETGDRIQIRGESHRMVLIGQTLGNTTAYAYPKGSDKYPSLSLPDNSNVIIKVNGINTVVGGTSATFPIGTTEAFGYHTAFKMIKGTGTQIGTAGGVQDFGIADGSVRSYMSITLDTTAGQENRVLFGLANGGANTQRAWVLTVDFHIQVIPSIAIPLDTDWALYQNSTNIQLQNRVSLLWN